MYLIGMLWGLFWGCGWLFHYKYRLLAFARSVSPYNGTNAARGLRTSPKANPKTTHDIVFLWQSGIGNRWTIPLEILTAVVTPLSLRILMVHFAMFYACVLFTSTTHGVHTRLAYRYSITAASRSGGCMLGKSVQCSELPLSN
ncbi:hypothetical protein QBC45DRAFT_466863 [Copromyces sp. CBS 386.78]|nr:hypothetical protein QBC45DRAFT_466863 [Copromyces sp. CBS 386.78]